MDYNPVPCIYCRVEQAPHPFRYAVPGYAAPPVFYPNWRRSVDPRWSNPRNQWHPQIRYQWFRANPQWDY